ncbi:hypothetical protein BTVI_41402 [Pitangus sulphuratus]|nr:hypothetical protein BTVI_41402 [Pitangus sulphuratus]
MDNRGIESTGVDGDSPSAGASEARWCTSGPVPQLFLPKTTPIAMTCMDPSALGLLRVEEQKVPIATTTVHHRQYCTNWDSMTLIHEMIRELESDQGVITEEVFEKGEKIIQILLKASFATKQSKIKGPAQEIQFLGVKWQDGCRKTPMDLVNKIETTFLETSKKETQAFLGTVGFWRMHIPDYSQIVNPLYHVTWKKNDFKWGSEQQQALEQIKQEIAHAVALGSVRKGQDVKNVLYTAARENGPS